MKNFNPLLIKPPPLLNISLFIQQTQNFHLDEHDIMVNFDVVSLFTKIPISEALALSSNIFDPETLNLVEICLSYTLFPFKWVFHEKIEGTTMGYSLSPMMANSFMEHFETLVLNNFHLKLKC
jgi:hypothetical protein